VRFAFNICLIKHEVFEVKNAELFQCAFTLLAAGALRYLGLRFLNQTFEIGGHHQTRTLLISLGYAIVKLCSSKAAGCALLNDRRQILKLIKLGTCRKQIVLNPNIQLVRLLVRFSCGRSRSQRISNEANCRAILVITLSVTGVLRDLLLYKLLEAGGVLEFRKHERRRRLALFIH